MLPVDKTCLKGGKHLCHQACSHVGGPKLGKIKSAADDAREASAKRGFPKNQPKGKLREGTSFLLM